MLVISCLLLHVGDCMLVIACLLLVYGIPVYRAFGIPCCRDTGNLRQRYGRNIYDCKFQVVNLLFSCGKGTVFLRCGRLNISSMYRVCNVYVSYIYRVSFVGDC